MKNNKGFTLVEIIAVVTILGLIALIAAPVVFNSIQKSKERSYVQQTKVLEETAERWSVKHAGELSETSTYYLEISQMVSDKLLTSDEVMDPRTNKKMNGCIVISYDKENLQFQFAYNENTCATLKG